MRASRKGAASIPDRFRALYDKLIRVRNHLEKLSVTHAWALREADLYDYHRTLDRIDDMRVNGNWVDEEGNPAESYVRRVRDKTVSPPLQGTCRLTTREPRCYSILSGGRTDLSSP